MESSGVRVDLAVVVPDRLLSWGEGRGALRRAAYYLRATWRSLMIGLRCAFGASRYDAVLMQRVIFPPPVPRLLRRRRRRIVYDFDDAIFTTHDPGEDWAARIQTWYHRRGLPAMLASASHTVVENDYTRAYAQAHCPAVSIITGPIDTDRYSPGAFREAPDPIVLGWIGSTTTERYLDQIRDPLEALSLRHPGLGLLLIGAQAFEVGAMSVERLDWDLDTEVSALRRIDIGLMPLPDNPWTRGKGGYKLLQYLSMGIPAVASPVGINREIVEHGRSGFLASNDAEWTEYLEALMADPELRRRMRSAGREKMVAQYSLVQSSRRLREILESVGDR
ncbi:MAG: glycosyltransferase family 4 protein [Candidatus Latescibacteria bacterium]|jgi:glycosyltransferase involved in cell wall biosynthesis|nr:glycosyltransferase family 4 protein [Candidatus Latescibacterota bacterium]